MVWVFVDKNCWVLSCHLWLQSKINKSSRISKQSRKLSDYSSKLKKVLKIRKTWITFFHFCLFCTTTRYVKYKEMYFTSRISAYCWPKFKMKRFKFSLTHSRVDKNAIILFHTISWRKIKCIKIAKISIFPYYEIVWQAFFPLMKIQKTFVLKFCVSSETLSKGFLS